MPALMAGTNLRFDPFPLSLSRQRVKEVCANKTEG